MRRASLVGTVLVLVVAACSGTGTDSNSDVATTLAATTTSVQGASDVVVTTTAQVAQDDGSGDSSGKDQGSASAIGTASVTIDGDTYRFAEIGPAVQCMPDFFGVFMTAMVMVDENGNAVPQGGSFLAILLHDGTDPEEVGQLNEARVKIAALDQDWIAREDDVELLGIDPGSSQIDSHTIDGNSVSATATFYEQNSYYAVQGGAADSVDVIQGTFEVTCSDS